jgi:hypothetical protein
MHLSVPLVQETSGNGSLHLRITENRQWKSTSTGDSVKKTASKNRFPLAVLIRNHQWK